MYAVNGANIQVVFDHCTDTQVEEEFVCWSRMQSEAGQSLEGIINRKERERRLGDGLFFWGVGNPPAVICKDLAQMKRNVRAVFSRMKSRPRQADTKPEEILVWRKFFDLNGHLQNLPDSTLVTSRGSTSNGKKQRHYALMCYSESPLELADGIPFDPSAYRNASERGGQVGSSQVTAMLRKVSNSTTDTDYKENLSATLIGSFWVKLTDSAIVPSELLEKIDSEPSMSDQEWQQLIKHLHSIKPSFHANRSDLPLF